jgi:predicted DNA-binding transcriptional regulator YafY
MRAANYYTLAVNGRNLVKLIKAVSLISRPQGASVRELEEELSISRRSVYRLRNTLEELNIRPYADKRPGEREDRWYLESEYLQNFSNLRLPEITLTQKEALLLFLLLSNNRLFQGSELESLLTSLQQKLSALMPTAFLSSSQGESIDSLFATSPLHPSTLKGKEEILDTILSAISQRQACTASYTALSHGNRKTYTIHPLKLFQHEGSLFLFVYIPKADRIRILAVERITSLTPQDKHFTEPEDFDPEALLATSFDLSTEEPVITRILFTPQAARRIRGKRWSANQEIQEHEDGSLTLTMEASGKHDILRWVLSFADQARIIDPPQLREELRQLLTSTLDNLVQ